MMMRTLQLLFAFTLITGCAAKRSVVQQTSSSIEGIWQMVGSRSNPDMDFRPRSNSTLKVLTGDSVIYNLVSTPNGSVIAARGQYIVESDSVYVEHILETPNNQAIDGKKVRLNYKIKDNKLMYLRFFLEKNYHGDVTNTTYEELWRRVVVPKVNSDSEQGI